MSRAGCRLYVLLLVLPPCCWPALVPAGDLSPAAVSRMIQEAVPDRMTLYLFEDEQGRRPFRAMRIDRRHDMDLFLGHMKNAAAARVDSAGAPAARILLETKSGPKWSFSIHGDRIQAVQTGVGGKRTAFRSVAVGAWLYDRIQAGEHILCEKEQLEMGFARYAAMTGGAGQEEKTRGAATGNLIRNGDFEQAAAGGDDPLGWDRVDKLTTFWTKDPDHSGRGMVLMMDTDVYQAEADARSQLLQEGRPIPEGPKTYVPEKDKYKTIGGSYGVSYYSDPIPVKPGQAYRVTLDEKGRYQRDFAAKVWIRGFGDLEMGNHRTRKRRLFDYTITMRNKDFRWRTWSGVFHPTKNTPNVREMRVMLYAYWPRGKYYFDNVRIHPVSMNEYRRAKKEERAEIK